MFRRSVHPGQILKDELDEINVTPTELARQIDVPANRISQIIAGKRSITGDTAEFWLNLQTQHDLAAAEKAVGDAVQYLPTRAGIPVPLARLFLAMPLTIGSSSGHASARPEPQTGQRALLPSYSGD